MTTELDLQQLAQKRGPSRLDYRVRRRPWLSRYVLPSVILGGFLTLLGWAARDRFMPSKAVTVIPVTVSHADVQKSGTPLFQAAGWIEPRPTAVLATALAEGIVEELLVVEGQSVEAGKPVARLIDADAKLVLQQAEASAELAAADLMNAQSELKAAQLRLENPVHLQALLSEADSLLAKTETELSRIPFLIEAADARSMFAQQNLEGKQGAAAAIPGRSIQQAQREHKIALSEVEELTARKPRLEQEQEALQKRRQALSRQLELLIDEKRQVSATEAQVKASQARQRQARLLVELAQLRLDRMTVKSPITGRVLALLARPGSRVMGLDPGGEQRASTIVSLYDPHMLQVRADVRLEDVPLIQLGQPVRIETPSAKGGLDGQVVNVTSQANIQKNTLEVKVAITSPSESIRPEMLVTTTFLAVETPTAKQDDSELSERLLVPRRLVEAEGDGNALWIVDPQGQARRKTVRLGNAGTEALVEVVEGLAPTDRLISAGRESLKNGDRVHVTGEDSQIGITSAPSIR
ncbi:MAG: efflux RND transporter periplasmic adaptor subunit [Planctomycetaceae bacterium]